MLTDQESHRGTLQFGLGKVGDSSFRGGSNLNNELARILWGFRGGLSIQWLLSRFTLNMAASSAPQGSHRVSQTGVAREVWAWRM